MHKLAVAIAALVTLAAPSLARAGDVAMRVQEIPVAATRALDAAPPAIHFNMLAFHWTGHGAVSYRTRGLHGAWTAWTEADADAAPDGGTGVWRDGNLEWTGASDAFQLRRRGDIRRLRAYELWARVTTAPSRHVAEAGSPTIVSRAAWGANEEIVRDRKSVV